MVQAHRVIKTVLQGFSYGTRDPIMKTTSHHLPRSNFQKIQYDYISRKKPENHWQHQDGTMENQNRCENIWAKKRNFNIWEDIWQAMKILHDSKYQEYAKLRSILMNDG